MKPAEDRLLALLKEARERLELERKRRAEPIALVGIGCRFPGGASSPAEFWDLLERGLDATTNVPLDRWDREALYDPDPARPGKCYTKRGGFLQQIAGFEAEFFGISPREARAMDPQQRLLLEVTWEALENAGIPPHRLRGSNAGVWVGLSLDDYATRSGGVLERIDPYTALGNARSLAAGRIAYVLGIHGPVMQLDTACSSSLVAIHLACQSLRAGECELGLVGGVNVMCSPEASVALCKLRALSPDGRCKTFDAAADGYGRGEGSGVVVLKTLSRAIADGDRIYAVIRGSAVNHDGPSNGLTAPNGLAQEAVIRSALKSAGLAALDVGYVEAHGTGTLLGDPIEVLALNQVYGAGRSRETPLFLGSVKTNLGHLEAAAGIAALIKAALCVANDRIVASLHCRTPNPKIPWPKLSLSVATEALPWPSTSGARVAGVSSFGISGTNAHVLIEQAPVVEARGSAPVRSAELLLLSSKSASALRASAASLAHLVEAHPEFALGDLAYSLLTTRSPLEHRKALAVPSRRALQAALVAISDGSDPVAEPTAKPSPPKIAFVFPGQGSQWLGMGRELLIEEPAFSQAMAACDRAIFAEAGWSVLEELGASPASSQLARVEVVQPVLFAIEVALAALWRSWGVEPDVVVGHSMGEVAAACVAGALSLEDGAAVICRRSRLLAQISGQGEMALVDLSLSEAQAALVGFEGRLSVAVSNGNRSTVLSGASSAIAELFTRLEAQGVFCRRVKVDVASHSPQVDPLLEPLLSALAGVSPGVSQLSMRSTVTSALLVGPELNASYWADNLRHPVCFAQVIEQLLTEGCELFLELSPHPILVSSIEELRQNAECAGLAVGSLRREQPERLTLLESLGALYTHGLPLDPDRLFPNPGRRLELPSYPWQRTEYWLDPAFLTRTAERRTHHPLLGSSMPCAAADAVYESLLSAKNPAWLADHRVARRLLVPGAGQLELLRAAASEHRAGLSCQVTGMVLGLPVLVPDEGEQRIQVVLTLGGSRAALYSQAADAAAGADWTLHATAQIEVTPEAAPGRVEVTALRRRCAEALDIGQVYRTLPEIGLDFGPAFQGMQNLWRGSGEALAELKLVAGLDATGYGVHPALLDAALQSVIGLLGAEHRAVLLPFEIARFTLYRRPGSSLLVHARLLEPMTGDFLLADLTLLEESGEIIAELSGLHSRRPDMSALAEAALPAVRRDLERTSSAPATTAERDFASALALLPEPARLTALTQLVRAEVARVLSLSSPVAVPLERPLKDLGFDSLMALEVRHALARQTALNLSTTAVFRHPTVTQLALHLVALTRDRAGDCEHRPL